MTTTAIPRPRLRRALGTVVRRVPGSAAASAIVLGLLIVLALGADFIRPLDTRSVELSQALQAPSLAHPMGTDLLGRDLFARALHGLRVSFAVSLVAAVCAAVIGGTIGLVAGAFGGRVDAAVMRLVDVFASQNHFLFGVLVVVLSRPVIGPAGAVLLSVGLTHWISIARIVRGELLSLRERPFVAAAINGGSGRLRLARRHYLPHLLPAASLGFVLLVPHAIFHESAYSFLGLGMPAHQASLGNLLADSQQSLLLGAWWASLLPGLLVFLASLSVGTLGEWWRDRRNPRWRSELEL
ncbi:MAG: ABC transporter permease [Egibacteraceae bacterium]